jgi:hypothetical protein
MKRIVWAMALGTLWVSGGRGDIPDGGKLQELCNRDRFAKACLAGLITFRCAQYHVSPHELGTCLDTSRDAARLLDLRPTTKDSSVQAVAFADELVFLMKDPFTEKFLKETYERVGEAMRHRTPFNLWSHTLKQMKGDSSKALWFLGVLLQDTSTATEHLEYLRDRKPPGVPDSAVEALSDLMDILQPEQLQKENFQTWLKLYPPMTPVGAEAHLNATVYHFYTLGYLSLRLKWANGKKRLATFIPFWIEVAYKFKSIAPRRWPLLDPEPFDRKENESRLRDIYATFLATHWAAGAGAPKIPFDEFADRMAADPHGYLKKLYLDFATLVSRNS